MLDTANTPREIWADSACRSEATEAKLKDLCYRGRIHKKGKRDTAQTKREQATNKTASTVRSRVEHVFGHTVSSMGEAGQGSDGVAVGMPEWGQPGAHDRVRPAEGEDRPQKQAYTMQRFTFLKGAKALAA